MVDREWREATDLRPATFWLAVVVAVGAVLRLLHLGHGIPFQIGVDEPELLSRVLGMMRTGDFNPRFFDYPGLMFYLHLGVACVRFLAGAAAQQFRSLADVGVEDLLLWGRAVTALFGIATIVVVHQIGMRWGARHALLGAGLLAVMPMHVRESHYVLTDVPATFFTALAFLLSLAAHERPTAGTFALAGMAAGLAMGTKYTAGAAVLLPLLAAWMTPSARPSRLVCVLTATGAWVGTFLVVAPYTVLDLPGFLNGFAHLMTYYRPRGPDADPSWLVYLKHLRLNLGWPAMVLLAAGLGLGLVRAARGPGRVRWALLVIFPVVFFYLLSGQGLVFGRYLLPIVPFACLLAANAVISGVSLLRRFGIPRAPRTALIVGLTVAALLPPALTAVTFVRTIGRTSTQALAYQWIREHLPEGTRIVVERHEVRLPETRYRVEYVTRLTDRTYEDYARAGVAYLLATSSVYGRVFELPEAHREAYDRYMTMRTLGREVARFAPSDAHPGPELLLIEVR